MKRTTGRSLRRLLLVGSLFCGTSSATALESTLPEDKYPDLIAPVLSEKYQYIEQGPLSESLGIPVYEWLPRGASPKVVLLGIHGLSLHGRRFRVLARTLAANGIAFVSLDMRGYGACCAAGHERFSFGGDDKSKIDNEKSYNDIVGLATLLRKQYSGSKLVAVGECLGCTFCTRLAGEHPDLIDGLILSGPSVKVNPLMYIRLGTIPRGLKAICTPSHDYGLNRIIESLISTIPEVGREQVDDPLVRKQIPLLSLFAAKAYVDRTARYGKRITGHLPVLIIQGGKDGCVSPKRVIDLIGNMKSDDQILSWKAGSGHLQLETPFMRAEIVDCVLKWLQVLEQGPNDSAARQGIVDAGGRVVD